MSLRRRLLLVVLLASVALVAALLAAGDVLAESKTVRLERGRREATSVVETWARTLEGDASRSFDDAAQEALGERNEAALGSCTPQGEAWLLAARGKHGERAPAPPPVPADQREAIAQSCRTATAATRVDDLSHPADTLLIATRRAGEDGRTAWAMLRVPDVDAEGALRLKADMSLLAALLVVSAVLTIGALRSLRPGLRTLEESFATLEKDLHATLARPRLPELAALVDRLEALARNLATSRDRERALLQDLAHRERLAGLGRVVAGAAHEIRNPLAGIKLKLDVMLRAGPTRADRSTERSEEIRACLREVERLDQVVRSLLQVARKDMDDGAREPLDLARLVRERLEHARDGDVVFEDGSEGRGVVSAGRADLARVVDNVLANALDAAGEGGHVWLRLGVRDARVVLAVEDDGPGVDEAHRDALFEPFFTTKADGVGLGLWLARAVSERAGGTLTYARRDGRSAFVLDLPSAARPA